MDLLQSLLALMTPIGLALFALLITREGQKDRAAENLRRDKRDEWDRDQRAKESQQLLLLFATITNKQDTNTSTVVQSGVASEARITQLISTSEATIKARINSTGDAGLTALDKAVIVIQATIQALADPMAVTKYDRALEILTAQVQDIADDINAMRADVVTNAEGVAANTTAITDAADALVAANVLATTEMPAAVVITAVSPSAVETIVSAVAGNGDSEDKKIA